MLIILKVVKKMKLNEVFPTNYVIEYSSSDDFLFNIFKDDFPEDIPTDFLNIEYFCNHSGEKNISPLLENSINTLTNDDPTLTENELFVTLYQNISYIIYSRYKFKWKKLIDTLLFKYNPIANVESKETFTYSYEGEEKDEHTFGRREDITNGGTITNDKSGEDVRVNEKSGEDIRVNEKSGEDVKTHTGESENEKFVSAFNTSEYAPTEKNTTTVNEEKEIFSQGTKDTETFTQGTKDTETFTQGTKEVETLDTTNTVQHSGSDIIKKTYNNRKNIEEGIREGNIGTTMTQQMIQAERELWKEDVINIFYKDIDNLLTIDTY